MGTFSAKELIIEQLDHLTSEQQQQVLDFTRSVARPRGEPGKLLLERTQDIHIDPEDLEIMRQVIE
jgi:hypothetical protein